MKEYQLVFIDKNQKSGTDFPVLSSWKKANCLTDFSSPWKEDAISKIEFRALWDLENLYFKFIVFDTDIYIDEKDNSFDSIGNSDRVELFFRKNEAIDPYYCLEMDTSARIMDFKAKPNKDFDFKWKWPKEDLKVISLKDKNSFTVEGRISIASLKELNLIQNNIIEAGVYRAKFSLAENLQYDATWISWVNPNTPEPNFHIASSFGKFILMK
ncbi:Carbohydrate family 9 binding domain-like [Flavobacterium aquidurense]|uniref:Endoxylanase n=1 Tax=Flavobacterium frigidimaris TaxID=262320 RepID=A0ABX4BNZ7_FLAFR|nr:sugar-binding protein [Flavobacterium frigidimaris]OXA78196.1 endoxylanase [Flavobacterium frigidimaris]SDY30189.1 Carbohydrate family 9 binding domain-like [Flavobacterium aquidurense]